MQLGLSLFIIAVTYAAYKISKNKGYPAIFFAVITFVFPFFIFVTIFLPKRIDPSKNRYQEPDYDYYRERSLPQKEDSYTETTSTQTQRRRSTSIESTANPDIPTGQAAHKEFTADSVVDFEHAMKTYKEEQYFLALPHFESVAATGHLYSQMMAAQMYYQGQGCEVNYERALYWYERAAEQNNVTAQTNCAYMYKKGLGCKTNIEKSLYWSEKAAEQGDPEIQFELAMNYELGHGIEPNIERARYWYEKAAAQGHEDAQRLLKGLN